MNDLNKNNFLARWINGDLSPEEEAAFKKSKDYETYKKIKSYSSSLEAPNFDKQKIFNNIKNKTKNTRKVRLLPRYKVLGIAASIIILLGIFSLLNPSNTNYKSNFGEQLAFVLPDGSDVILNANSSISYDKAKWKKGTRTLNLDGEAYFKVEKGSLFTVLTKKGDVEVLGTQFNVNTNANCLEVKCFSGKVSVSNKINKSILTQGKAVRYIEDKKEPWSFNTTVNDWRTANNSFENSTLEKVFVALENQFNIKIENKNAYTEKRFTGSFSNASKTEALETVFEAMNIKYSINKNTITPLK